MSMWPILFRNVGLIAKTPHALFGSRLFSSTSAKLRSAPSTRPSAERQRLLTRTDEEWHTKNMARCRAYIRRVREENPNLEAEENKKAREKYATDPRYRSLRRLAHWTRRHAWVREELPWKSHRPVVYTSPVRHCCESCGITRRNGLRLVWQSITQPDSYSCHACYMNQDAEAYMPEGYEDIRTMKGLAARKSQLEELKTEAPRAGNTADNGKGKKQGFNQSDYGLEVDGTGHCPGI